MKAHEGLIHTLHSEGVDTIFTLMSEDIMSTLSLIDSHWGDKIDIVQARHEQGAMLMADGYSRATDEVGVCMIGRGPAIAQTGTAMVTARRHGSKVLLIVPESRLSDTHDLKRFEQTQYLHSTIGNVNSVRNPTDVLPQIRRAFTRVRNGESPLAIQIPWDVLDADIDVSVSNNELPRSGDGHPSPPDRPSDAAVDEAVELLLDSDATIPPIILAGRGAIQSDARPLLEDFAAQISGLLTTTLHARGYFDDHPFHLGFSGTWGNNLANAKVIDADLAFIVGASLNPHTTDHGFLYEDTKLIHIDTNLGHIGEYTPVDVAIEGDATETIRAITAKLDEIGIDRDGELWTSSLQREIENHEVMNDRTYPEVPETMDPRDLAITLDGMLPDRPKVVVDAGHVTRWVLDGIRTPPEDFIWPIEFSSIGLALPLSIGVALAADEHHCVAICGDAGLMMSLQELETIGRYGIPMTIIAWNDSTLGTEYHSLKSWDFSPDIAKVPTPDFADVAESVGITGYTASSIDELLDLEPVFDQTRDEPALVDCRVNPEVRHRSK